MVEVRVSGFRLHAPTGCAAAALLVACGAVRQPFDLAQGDKAGTLSATYQQLQRFHPRWKGVHPAAGLLEVNGTLYGTTTVGGRSRSGTIYSMSTSGVEKVLYRFQGGSDGSDPQSGLLNVNGTLYGTTASGGSSNAGTVYSVSTSGVEDVLYSFESGSDGANPAAGLIDVKGTLYGTTVRGGGSGCHSSLGIGCGTVFSVTTRGKETVLHSFARGSDGAYPFVGLVDVKGVLYGTTAEGGNACGYSGTGCGTVYSITPAGVEKVLYAFQDGSDGNNPQSGLIDVNGMLYGTTSGGGQAGSNCEYGNLCGTVYRINARGAEKVLYRFAGGSDGATPEAGLTDVNGVMYGTTMTGGGGTGSCFAPNGNCGTVYSITIAGVETVLYRFTGGKDGYHPLAPLTNVNGTLYGTTFYGGDHDVCCTSYGYGTVFTLSP
jgi:uncharacterized repeat protein (TIGR03803 family)